MTKEILKELKELQEKHNFHGDVLTKINNEIANLEDKTDEFKKVVAATVGGQSGAPIYNAFELLKKGEPINSAALVLNLFKTHALNSEDSLKENKLSFIRAANFFKNDEQPKVSADVGQKIEIIWNIIKPVLKTFIASTQKCAEIRLQVHKEFINKKQEKEAKKKEKYNKKKKK